MLKWLRNWLRSKEVSEDRLQRQIEFINGAAKVFESDYAMIVSFSEIDEGQQVSIFCKEGLDPVKMLHFAHKTIIEEPTGKSYTRIQIQMQIDFWLDKLNEYEFDVAIKNKNYGKA